MSFWSKSDAPLSENEILQAAQDAKKVLLALFGLLDAIDQKTGFEQKAADAEARYKAANDQELVMQAHLATLNADIEKASGDLEAVKESASKILSNAEAKANDTRLAARNEAGLMIQDAQKQAQEILNDLASKQAALESIIVAKQKQSDALDSTIASKTAELNKVQGDLDAAKDEIRRKFLV